MFWNVTFSATKATLVQLDSNGQHFGEEPQSHEELPRRETLEHYLTRIANRGSHVK